MPDHPRPQTNSQSQGLNQDGDQSPLSRFISIAQRVFIFWIISQLISKFLSSKLSTPVSPDTTIFAESSPSDADFRSAAQFLPTSATPAWPLRSKLTMHIYLSTMASGVDVVASKWSKIRGGESNDDDDIISVVWDNITYGSWDDAFLADFKVPVPSSVQHNGSFWADIFLVKNNATLDPSSRNFDPYSVHHVRKQLNEYLPRAKVQKVKSLLSSSDDDTEIEHEEQNSYDGIISYWHPNLTVALVSDAPMIPYSKLSPVIAEHVPLIPGVRDKTGTSALYKPLIFTNDFWHLRSQYMEINETTSILPLQIVFQPMSYFKFQIFASIGQGFSEVAKQKGPGSGGEIDEIKRMLVETNPYFLGLTAIVSILHVLFEMLAFKSDISHWRKKEELTGVSIRTIILNVFIQTIILLYLLDNNEETSWMIFMGQGVGILIEAWKITKVLDIKLLPSPAGSVLPYMVRVTDKHALNEDEKKTQEYDKLASRYVSYATIPLLAGYSVYSLIYNTHRGWYSFILSTLTSFVYMFGFAQLIPQLIINYKLKSVAHMPMNAMIYKTLSTVVDDLFAFCIKMPLLHRLACFRDDLVFLVFLYQRWIYRIDPKRANEYGQMLKTDEASPEQFGKESKKEQ